MSVSLPGLVRKCRLTTRFPTSRVTSAHRVLKEYSTDRYSKRDRNFTVAPI